MSEPRIWPSAKSLRDQAVDILNKLWFEDSRLSELDAAYDKIDALLAQARREALEEAAKIVEKGLPSQMLSCVRRSDAEAIRALAAQDGAS